jgi:hypothetical protein
MMARSEAVAGEVGAAAANQPLSCSDNSTSKATPENHQKSPSNQAAIRMCNTNTNKQSVADVLSSEYQEPALVARRRPDAICCCCCCEEEGNKGM